MRKALWVLAALFIVLLLLMKPLLNLSPLALGSAASVATGLGAKLACSGRYITGLSREQIQSDLASYSPAFKLVDIDYDEDAARTTASLFALASASAQFRPAVGCTLERGEASALNSLVIPPHQFATQATWPQGEAVSSVEPAAQAALDKLLAADNDEGFQTRALLMVRGGRVVAESYQQGFDASTAHLGWSMAKSVTAILLGLAEYDGLVGVSDKHLLPDWRHDARAEISVENLLQMTSGLAFDEEYIPGSDATRMLAVAVSAASVAVEQPIVHRPGEFFSYSSGTTNILALLYQHRVGGDSQSALNYLHQRLLQPLGMQHTWIEPDPSGVFVGSSYIYASARDWARLGLLMLGNGEFQGQRLLTTDWVQRAQTPNNSENDRRYGYQFWLNGAGAEKRWPELPDDAYAMMGNRGQVVMMIPSLDVVIVRLGWSASPYPQSQKFLTLL